MAPLTHKLPVWGLCALAGLLWQGAPADAALIYDLGPKHGCYVDENGTATVDPQIEICLEPFSTRAIFDFTIIDLKTVVLDLTLINTSDPSTEATLTAIGFNKLDASPTLISASGDIGGNLPDNKGGIIETAKFDTGHPVFLDPLRPGSPKRNTVTREMCITSGSTSEECDEGFAPLSDPSPVFGLGVGETEMIQIEFDLKSALLSASLDAFEALFDAQADVVGHFHLPGTPNRPRLFCSEFDGNGDLIANRNDDCVLVKSALAATRVAEPKGLALFGFGLVILGALRRRITA